MLNSNTSGQVISPELRQWIVEQLRVPFTPEQILQSMRSSGWQEAVAQAALASTLANLQAQTTLPGTVNQAGVPVPRASIDDAPLYLDAGDKQVAVLQVMTQPHLVVFGGLLSDDECATLIEAARPRMARSLTVINQTGGEEVHADRTSNGMFFRLGENDVVAKLEARIARLLNWPLANGEDLQVLHYQPGAEYKPHYDYFDPNEPGTPTILKRGGQRVATVIVYLGEPEKGGGTTFPNVNLVVAPKRGNAVFFSYDKPHPSTLSLHGGAPVIAGEKWIATKWLREGIFI
ncbi:MAG: 2OG-Fe(II) oxygenase [Burkholderiales bacterium]